MKISRVYFVNGCVNQIELWMDVKHVSSMRMMNSLIKSSTNQANGNSSRGSGVVPSMYAISIVVVVGIILPTSSG